MTSTLRPEQLRHSSLHTSRREITPSRKRGKHPAAKALKVAFAAGALSGGASAAAITAVALESGHSGETIVSPFTALSAAIQAEKDGKSSLGAAQNPNNNFWYFTNPNTGDTVQVDWALSFNVGSGPQERTYLAYFPSGEQLSFKSFSADEIANDMVTTPLPSGGEADFKASPTGIDEQGNLVVENGNGGTSEVGLATVVDGPGASVQYPIGS